MINLVEKSEGKETSNFWPKSKTNPFVKMQILHVSKPMFCSLEKVIFYQKHWQTLFLINFVQKIEGQETSNFWPKEWTNRFAKKAIFSTSKYQLICSLLNFFSLKNVSKHSFWSIWTRKNEVRKRQIFDQNYNLTPL